MQKVHPSGGFSVLLTMAIGAGANMLVDAMFQLASGKDFNVGQLITAGVQGAAGGGLAGVTNALKTAKTLSNLSKTDKAGVVTVTGVTAAGVSVGAAQVNSITSDSGPMSGTDIVMEVVSSTLPTPGKALGGAVSELAETSSRNGVTEALLDETISSATAKEVGD